METFEDLGAALGTIECDSERLIAAAVRDGRRRQRRRRLGITAGVLAVGALAVGTSLHLGGTRDADGLAVAGDTTPTDTTSTGSPSDLPSADLTDARLAARLPAPGDPVSATTRSDGVDVERTLDPDGTGAGSVSLYLSTEAALGAKELSGTEEKCRLEGQASGPESCHPVADGWMFTYTSHPDVVGAADKALDWSATVVHADGTTVSVHATNYVDKADPTRLSPVLSLNQISDLANDPVWFQPAP
jgi:hypothetical protein